MEVEMRLFVRSRHLAVVLGCACLLAGSGATVMPLFTANEAFAASMAKVDAAQLQLNMRRSISTILIAYKQEPRKGSRADAMLIKAAGAALRELAKLEAGTKARDPKIMTTATSKLSVAVGRIEAISDSAKIANPTVREGIRALSTNWAAYGTRYALTSPSKAKPVRVTSKQVRDLQTKVAALRSQVTRLQTQAATNRQLAGNVRRLSAQLDRIEQERINEANYQRTVFLLGSFIGWVDGYHVVSAAYYPSYTSYFIVEPSTYTYWETCWTDYYEPYYTYTDWSYYDDPFTPTVNVNIQIDASTQIEVNHYAEQNIDVLVDESSQAENYFETLRPDEADVDLREVNYTPPVPAYELEEDLAEPSRKGVTATEVDEGSETRSMPAPADTADEPYVTRQEKQSIPAEDHETSNPSADNDEAMELANPEPPSVDVPAHEQSGGADERELPVEEESSR